MSCSGSPPQIVGLNPTSGASGVPADAPVRIAFDQPMDRASVTSRLTVDPSLRGCALGATTAGDRCPLQWSADSSTLTIEHPDAPFAPSTTYRFSLDAGIRDQGGAENSLDHHWSITSAPAPTVRSLTPGDGATGVDVDADLAVDFSTPMAPASTVAAILLEPPVPGSRVLPNARDHSRFVLLPGRLLAPHTDYRLTVLATATDEHGQVLDAPAATRFTTGTLGGRGHAAILTRRAAGAEDPSQVLLSGLGPARPGDPVAAVPVLTSPVCPTPTCGHAAAGAPLTGYLAVALAPGGPHLAVVERDETAPQGAATSLHVVNLATGEDSVVSADADLPAWSPRGRRLAFRSGDLIHVLSLTTGAQTTLPSGDPLTAAPVWSPDARLLALPVRSAGGTSRVDLADPALDARYPLPTLEGDVSDPVFDPAGNTVAVLRDGDPSTSGTWVVRLRGGDASPRRVAAEISPVAYSADGTLVAVQRPTDGTPSLVRVSVASGEITAVPGGPAASDLDSVIATSTGRQLGYLLTDSQGVVQAMLENADGSNPIALTGLAPGDGVDAVAISMGG